LNIKGNPIAKETEAVEASQIGNQNSINGTQDGQTANPGAPRTAGMGPGTGSGNVVMTSVINPPASTGAILATTTFATPVTISTSGQTTTLAVVGSAASSGPVTEVGSLAVFSQNAGSPPTLQGNFVVHQSSVAISLTPATTASRTLDSPAAPDSAIGKSAPFTLSLENGITLQMTASVTPAGVLVVSAPEGAGQVDVKQAVLMGAQVARQALQVELSSLSSALFVRR